MRSFGKNKNGFPPREWIAPFFGSGGDGTFARIEEEYQSDVESRKTRSAQFEKRFPTIDKTPLMRGVARGLYSHGSAPVISLIAILLIFTAIKAPYFSMPFTGEHPTKYNTYVEPALYMSQTNNPLLYQKKYVADPVTNPAGIFNKFDHLPLFEWGLGITYKIIPFGSVETKTRLFTHFIGLWLFVLAYIFFIRWLPTKLTFLVLALMSVNPIIVFGTYVTVLDSLVILCMFLSFIMLNGYFQEGNISRLFWAGIIYGIGVSVKYSLLLWMAPISLLLIFYQRESVADFVRNFLIYSILGILGVITFKTTIGKIIVSPIASSGFLAGWILFYWALFRVVKRYQSEISRWIEIVYRKKLTLFIFGMILFLAGFAVFRFFKFGDYLEEYLTDPTLLFNPRMYKYMLLYQFKNYMTRMIFWTGMTGFLLVFTLGNPRSRKLVSSFLFGSVAYWLIASKAIFFHNYYTLIFMILFSVTASFSLYYIYMNMPSLGAKVILVLLFSALILPPAQGEAVSKINRASSVTGVVNFIRENTQENDFILYEGFLSPLVIYTGRGFVKPATLASDSTREEIQKLGFAETMRKYRIKYFFSPNEKPFFKDFAPLFAKTKLIEPSGTTFNRNISIFRVIGQEYPEMDDDLREVEQIENKFDIPGKFRLVAKIGKYKFYSFLN